MLQKILAEMFLLTDGFYRLLSDELINNEMSGKTLAVSWYRW